MRLSKRSLTLCRCREKNPKPEIRDPKEIRRPNERKPGLLHSAFFPLSPLPVSASHPDGGHSDFGPRPSFGSRVSGLGFRTPWRMTITELLQSVRRIEVRT